MATLQQPLEDNPKMTDLDYIKQDVQFLKTKIQGNGQPGLLSDVQAIKTVVDSQKASFERLERMIAELGSRLGSVPVHDTQEIERITKEQIAKALREHCIDEENKKGAPGTWLDFRNKFLIPIMLYIVTTVIGISIGLQFAK